LVDDFFEVGCFGNLVADMNIHEKPLRVDCFHPQLQSCSSWILLLLIQMQVENDELLVLRGRFGPVRVPRSVASCKRNVRKHGGRAWLYRLRKKSFNTSYAVG
jgi:hypothetical protein